MIVLLIVPYSRNFGGLAVCFPTTKIKIYYLHNYIMYNDPVPNHQICCSDFGLNRQISIFPAIYMVLKLSSLIHTPLPSPPRTRTHTHTCRWKFQWKYKSNGSVINTQRTKLIMFTCTRLPLVILNRGGGLIDKLNFLKLLLYHRH